MLSFAAFIALLCLCDGRPMDPDVVAAHGRFIPGSHIVGGTDATAGAWPSQLSFQQLFLGSWYHICGAVLLSCNKVLTAAHCVDGFNTAEIRIVAGLHDKTDETGAQIAAISSYTKHERYEVDPATTSNDIATIRLATCFTTGPTIQYASLPPNNNDQLVGDTCVMTGWGRTGDTSSPSILQQASIKVISSSECANRMAPVSSVSVWDYHICLYDNSNQVGSCSGDSGGPLHCPNGFGGYFVAGVTSWGIFNTITETCLQTYPSVYTRTSAYIGWIFNN